MNLKLLQAGDPVKPYARAVARAFVGYPVMQHAFCDSPGSQEEWIFEMIKRSAEARQRAGMKIPYAEIDGRVAAGANLSLPETEPRPEKPDWFSEFLATAGPSASQFFPRFIEMVDTIELPKPSAYLIMIGVDPAFQGQGVGRRLIDYCFDLANENPENQGMGLDTEDEKNVEIYRRCGFEVVKEMRLDDMPIYALWRPR